MAALTAASAIRQRSAALSEMMPARTVVNLSRLACRSVGVGGVEDSRRDLVTAQVVLVANLIAGAAEDQPAGASGSRHRCRRPG